MSNSKASDFQEISKSRAYQRMKRDNPEEFEPHTIFFATSEKEAPGIDWQNCLQLKAAMVYHAITGKHVNKDTKTIANKLLREIAEKCKALIGQYSIESITDGIFLVVGFLSELSKFKDREEANNHYLKTHKEEIVRDIIKIENQLSLKLIYDIVEHVETAIINSRSKETKLPDGVGEYKLSFLKEQFHDTISRFCWYYSPFFSDFKDLGKDVRKLDNLLQCLHHSLMKANQSNGDATGEVSRCPSARQLKRSGVRFEVSPAATIDVRFTKPTLKMPALAYDFKLETVVRNLLAWECLPKEDQKPVTRYFQLINELAGDLSDVRVMMKFGLIKGWWKNLREVLDMVKRIDGSVSYPSVYMDLDKEIRKVSDYNEERMKSFFVRNRPAVVWFSSVAAVSAIGTVIYASKRRRG